MREQTINEKLYYLTTHNKNYNKTQYNYICEIQDELKATTQNIFGSINNRLSLYYPHGAIPYDVFFDVLQSVAKENGIEIE